LGALDVSFAQLKTPAKLGLVADMCSLVEAGPSDAAAAAGVGTPRLSAEAAALPVARIAETNAADEGATGSSQFAMKMSGKQAHQAAAATAAEGARVAAAAAHLATTTKAAKTNGKTVSKAVAMSAAAHVADDCSLCAGFSAKTCSAALTNVVSGLDAPSRLDVQHALLHASAAAQSPSCVAVAEQAAASGRDAAVCLAALDVSFATLAAQPKADLASSMCALLEAQAAADGTALSRASRASSRPLTTDDESAVESAHTANTRAFLLGGSTSATTTVSKPTVFSAASVTAAHGNTPSSSAPLSVAESALSVELDALASQVTAEPTCALCDAAGSDRQCLAALDAALRGLSDRQRLTVTWRALPQSTTQVACPAGTVGDKACLKNLDAQLSALTSSRRLQALSGACEVGAYAQAAAQLAAAATLAASPAYAGVPVATLNVPLLMAQASSASGVAAGAAGAADALAAALAAAHPNGYLAGGARLSVRDAVKMALGGWHAALGGLAAVALPSVTATPTATTSGSSSGAPPAHPKAATPPDADAASLSQGWLGRSAAAVPTAVSALSAGFATGARALVTNLAVATQEVRDLAASSADSAGSSSSSDSADNYSGRNAAKSAHDALFMAMGHSAAGFVLGACAAASVAYAVVVVRRRRDRSASKQYTAVPELPPKWNEQLYESPAFVLNL
jgi:hypothetical protein